MDGAGSGVAVHRPGGSAVGDAHSGGGVRRQVRAGVVPHGPLPGADVRGRTAPAGRRPSGEAGRSPGGFRPHFLFEASKRKRPRPVKRKDAETKGRPEWAALSYDGGRANRRGEGWLHRRPCAGHWRRKSLVPAQRPRVDGRGGRRIDQRRFPLPLPRRSTKVSTTGGSPIRPYPPNGRPASTAGAARNARRSEQGQIRQPPRSPAAPSMRLQGLSTAGVRRRDDGAIDACRTDSHAPPLHEDAARMGRIFVKSAFSLGPAQR